MGFNLTMIYILLSEKKWHKSLYDSLKTRKNEEWHRISHKSEFNIDNLNKIKPNIIFIPHWSYLINSEIFQTYTCVVFHMTDLPFGRGGSPLQNLIINGHNNTKITAFKVDEGIDSGDIYLKEDLELFGTAKEIFSRSSLLIKSMITKIIDKNILPKPQEGNPTYFKRRKSEDGNLADLNTLKLIYDFIRMLDAPGYPNAFIETESFRFEFTNAKNSSENQIKANVRIIKK